jgi:hypothetical protein
VVFLHVGIQHKSATIRSGVAGDGQQLGGGQVLVEQLGCSQVLVEQLGCSQVLVEQLGASSERQVHGSGSPSAQIPCQKKIVQLANFFAQ